MRCSTAQSGTARRTLPLRRRAMKATSFLYLVGVSVQAQSSTPPVAPDVYLRYTRPGQCTQAVIRENDLYWRDKRQDTVTYMPTVARVPAPVLDVARRCAARFRVSAVAERDLLELTRLYLWGQQDSLAHVASERLLNASVNISAHTSASTSARTPIATSTRERGWMAWQVVSSYLEATPVRIDAAKRYLARLDTLGSRGDTATATWRMLAYTAVAKYAMSVNDVAGALANAKAATMAGAQMNMTDRIDWAFSLVESYQVLADATAIQAGGAAAVAVFDSASAALNMRAVQRARVSESEQHHQQTMMMMEQQTIQQLAENVKMMIADLRESYTIVGTAPPPYTVSHWYGTGADTTPIPARGAVTLLVSLSPNCSLFCYGTYSSIRRLYERYHAAGLRIVLVTSTQGYFKDRPQQNPTGEAEAIRQYVLDFLKLPGVLGITESQFSNLMDGRRVNLPQQSRDVYFRGHNGVVVGKDGTVRMIGNVNPEREQLLAAVIGGALAK